MSDRGQSLGDGAEHVEARREQVELVFVDGAERVERSGEGGAVLIAHCEACVRGAERGDLIGRRPFERRAGERHRIKIEKDLVEFEAPRVVIVLRVDGPSTGKLRADELAEVGSGGGGDEGAHFVVTRSRLREVMVEQRECIGGQIQLNAHGLADKRGACADELGDRSGGVWRQFEGERRVVGHCRSFVCTPTLEGYPRDLRARRGATRSRLDEASRGGPRDGDEMR